MSTSNAPRNIRRTISTPRLALGGMLAALVFVATAFVKLPFPMTHGYVHLGDGFILLGAALLGWVAVPAAAIGSLLSDLLLGYVPYTLPTLVIKSFVAVAALRAGGQKPLWLSAIWFFEAEVLMILGYFLAEWLLLGYGLAAAWAGVPANAIQGTSGIVIAMALLPVVRRVRMPKGWK